MQSISRSLRFCRHRCASFIASGAPHGYPPALSRRSPLNQAASVLPAVLPAKRLGWLPRFAYEPYLTHHSIALPSEKRQVNLLTTKGMDEPRKEINDVHDSESTAADDTWPADSIWHASVLENSSHRDGAIINKGNWGSFLMDIADRNETVLELGKFSKGQPCYPDEENCIRHLPSPMIQIFSLRLAKTPIDSGSMQLYGYMAARDDMDGRLNYVFNHSRDNPVIVQQGSLFEMTGPRRGILTLSDVLMEFDMRIKTAEREEDDLQLIDGLIHLDQLISTSPFILRFNGSCGGAVDMCLTLVEDGMEAIIEVVISEVQDAFDLSLSSIVSFTTEPKEFQLFHGAVGELSIKRFVVAIPMDAMMHLKFKVGEKGSGDVHYCSFSSKQHGCVNRQIDLEVACISVKVTVSAPWL